MGWLSKILREIGHQGAVVRVSVVRSDGSTPRETGAAMLVSKDAVLDTIGGGALEHEAIAQARAMLAGAEAAELWRRDVRAFALGPGLGQCCGGAVLLLFELFTRRERAGLEALSGETEAPGVMVARQVESGSPPILAAPSAATDEPLPPGVARLLCAWHASGGARPMLAPGRNGEPDWYLEPLAASAVPLVIYGAGHVGRALVRVLEGLPFAITWVDGRPDIFPGAIPAGVAIRACPIDAPPATTALPRHAIHLVMTHSHPLDLEICHAVLRENEFRFLGLIGSRTKRARFVKRLGEAGIPAGRIERLVCPIGVPGIEGKQPAIIALSIAAQLLQLDAARLGSR